MNVGCPRRAPAAGWHNLKYSVLRPIGRLRYLYPRLSASMPWEYLSCRRAAAGRALLQSLERFSSSPASSTLRQQGMAASRTRGDSEQGAAVASRGRAAASSRGRVTAATRGSAGAAAARVVTASPAVARRVLPGGVAARHSHSLALTSCLCHHLLKTLATTTRPSPPAYSSSVIWAAGNWWLRFCVKLRFLRLCGCSLFLCVSVFPCFHAYVNLRSIHLLFCRLIACVFWFTGPRSRGHAHSMNLLPGVWSIEHKEYGMKEESTSLH